jgi:hypothetical protein
VPSLAAEDLITATPMDTTRMGTISGPVALGKVAGRDGNNRNLKMFRVSDYFCLRCFDRPTIRVVRRFECMARKSNSGCEPGGHGWPPTTSIP